MDDRIPSRHALLLLLAVYAAAWFGTLEYRKLVKPDEGRYAEIPREMVASGDWVTPRLNDIKYFEKPALQYWATAAAYSAFGEHHWTARLWPALTGFLGILAVWLAGLRLYGPRAALYGAAALGGSILWVLIGHINTLDMGVSFFLSLAIFGFVLAQRDDAPARENRNAMLLAWSALGLAVLSKGLIGLVLPGAALVLYTLWQRDWALWRRLHLGKGLALLLAITAPWFVAVSLANPEFFHFFFIHEHFERFMTKAHGRYQPMWYFLPILAVGFLPWTLALVSGMAGPFRREGAARFRPDRFLLVWIAVVFGFFSVSSSKLVAYILPLFPAAALLAGRALAEARCRTLRWHAAALLPLALAWIGVAVTQVPNMASPEVPLALFNAYVPWLVTAGAALAATAIAAFVLFRREAKTAGVLVLSAGGLLFAQLALSGHDSLAPANSAWQIVETIRPEHRPDIPFYSVNTYDQTLQPYLKRTTTMVGYMDELGFGIAQEPGKFIPDLAAFEKVWNNQPAALALMDAETYEKLAAHALPMRVIARDTRRIIVRKP
jgi:4-amino-4-deoxy-L-arabinose transferase-like glycosyltransferase